MRVFLGWAVALLLITAPAIVKAGGPGDSPATANAPAPSPAKDAAKESPDTTAAAKTDTTSLEAEIDELRDLLQSQAKQLQTQNDQLTEQQKKMQQLEDQLSKPSGPREDLAAAPSAAGAAPVSTGSPSVLAATTAAARPIGAATPPQGGPAPDAPLSIHLGSAYITPIGFMDFTTVIRSSTVGSGIGTNFAGIPYGFSNTTGVSSTAAFENNLSEFRMSMQNSRIGFRVDAPIMGAHVIGYMEADFLGNNPANVAVSSNSNTLRSRLYWVDVRKGSWEVLGGQTWSLITPGRAGISPLPGNLFYSQDIDVNYQSGLVWGRIPELRFVWHAPSDKAAFAIALDNGEQYIGGSSGGPVPTGPTNFSATQLSDYGLSAATNAEVNDAQTTLNAPNTMPDIIVKLAIDPNSRFHAETGGIYRRFAVWNPGATAAGAVTAQPAGTFNANGAGAFLNLGFEPIKGFRLLTNNFWNDGGGRYIYGEVPDFIVRGDGSISPIKSASTVSGFEWTHKNTMLYGYYGGIYVYKNLATDQDGKIIGYGVPAGAISAGGVNGVTSQNKSIQEITGGFNQTVWKDGKYGAVNVMGQYSYLLRNPWSFPVGGPKDTHLNMIFFNLRYTLPGAAPSAAALGLKN